MNKLTNLVEGIVYLIITYLTQQISKYIYSFSVFWLEKSGQWNIYDRIVSWIGFEGQVMEFIYATRLFYILLGWFIALIIIFTLSHNLESVFQRKLLGKSNFVNNLLSMLIGFGLVFILYSVVEGLSKVLMLPTFYVKNNLITGIDMIFTLLTVGIIIPIFEELFFRWILLNKFNETMPNILGILLQSLLFSFFHFNIVQGIYVFVLGFICGYVVVKTKVIFNSMLIHMVFNITNLYIYYLIDFEFLLGQLLFVIVFGFVMLFVGLQNLNYTKLNNI